MKKMKHLWVIALLGIATNCQQNEVEIAPDFKVQAAYTTARDMVAVNFAKNLAVALKQPNVREFIKEETTKQFDGDYNFLFGTHKNRTIAIESANGRAIEMSFKDILFGQESAKNGRASGSSFLDSLTEVYPLLQVALPELANASAETWDAENEIPLIAVIPRSTNGLEFILAYDSEGNVHQLPIDEEPTEPIIVISENERLIGVDKNTNGRIAPIECPMMEQQAYFSTPTTNYYFLNDYFEIQNRCRIGENPPNSGNPPSGGTPSCDRDKKTPKMSWLK